MRIVHVTLAVMAACALSTPASAALFVQTTNELIARPVTPFDATWGRLDRVTIEISVDKSRAWQINVPQGAAYVDVPWSVNGTWQLRNPLGGSSPVTLDLTGSDTTRADLTFQADGRSYGLFHVQVSGSKTIEADPSIFMGQPLLLNGDDLGFYDTTGADTTFGAIADAKYLRIQGGCTSYDPAIEDYCGMTSYRVTYDYTPASELGGVPEPATWAMMILGFGAVGTTMRRRRHPVAHASA